MSSLSVASCAHSKSMTTMRTQSYFNVILHHEALQSGCWIYCGIITVWKRNRNLGVSCGLVPYIRKNPFGIWAHPPEVIDYTTLSDTARMLRICNRQPRTCYQLHGSQICSVGTGARPNAHKVASCLPNREALTLIATSPRGRSAQYRTHSLSTGKGSGNRRAG